MNKFTRFDKILLSIAFLAFLIWLFAVPSGETSLNALAGILIGLSLFIVVIRR